MIVLMVLALASPQSTEREGATVILQTPRRDVQIDHLFFETASGRTQLPSELTRGVTTVSNRQWSGETRTADDHRIRLAITPRAGNFVFSMTASPATDIRKWGLAIESKPDEYFTGLMERVVDGPQQASWAPGISAAMNLRGQRVDMDMDCPHRPVLQAARTIRLWTSPIQTRAPSGRTVWQSC